MFIETFSLYIFGMIIDYNTHIHIANWITILALKSWSTVFFWLKASVLSIFQMAARQLALRVFAYAGGFFFAEHTLFRWGLFVHFKFTKLFSLANNKTKALKYLCKKCRCESRWAFRLLLKNLQTFCDNNLCIERIDSLLWLWHIHRSMGREPLENHSL